MRTFQRIHLSVAALLALSSIPALGALPGDERAPLRASDVRSAVQPVAAWDPASPQRLFRIDGALYQLEEPEGTYYRVIEDTITVRLAPGVKDWNDLLERIALLDAPAHAALTALVPLRRNRLGIVDLRIPDASPTGWCALLFQSGLVRYAEVSTYGVFLATPNDPQYPQQWALNNTGQTGGTPDADIDAPQAWDLFTGDPSVIVGVLDSGTAVAHEDLAANIWHNPGEVPSNGVDDDGNGFIDDVDGWDFGNNNNNVNANNFHGTHVAGIVVGVGGNGKGIAGLAGGLGTPGARAMIVAVGDAGPVGSIIDDSILYAIDNGARLITLSLAVGQSSAIDDAMDQAYFVHDLFIDCAAGNNGGSVTYPANQPQVMAVASTTDDDQKSSFSNPGPDLEVSAPGSDILSTQLGNSYGLSSGTSFAAPYVGALAALIRGYNPGLTAPEVRQLIIDSSEDVGAPGFDNQTGWGRINAYEALLLAGSSDGKVELDLELYACDDAVTVTVSDFDLGDAGTLVVTISSGSEPGGESVLLDEGSFGRFTGTISLDSGPAAADGKLQVTHQDTLVARYVDADDGEGGSNVLKTAEAATDCAGPQIGGVSALDIDDVSARIVWTTDEPSTTAVRYGESTPEDEVSSSNLVTTHVIALSDLSSCTLYHFEVESVDALGNSTIDDAGGTLHAFQTLGNFPGIGVAPCQLGQADLDREIYGCDGAILVTVTDIDLNADTEAPDTAEVLMTSTSEPAGEWITLTETASSTGIFEGSIDLDAGAPGPDGQLSVAPADLVTATYHDQDDGQGQARIETSVSSVDCTGPAITDVRVVAITSTRAAIEWTTDEPATSRVDFGATALLGASVEDGSLTTSHSLVISAFEACERVHFRISSADELGDVGMADAGGSPYQFNLDRIGGLVFHDNFETDQGWQLLGEWQRGAPAAGGSGSGDPALAYSGGSVLGTDLSGSGAFPGDYEPGQAASATSPVMSTIGASNLELIFKRKLGLAVGATAGVSLVKLFTQQIWSVNQLVDDADWIEQRHPIPNADNQTAVRIAFSLQGGAGHSYGWNLDEVIVKDSTQPDYVICGGCAGAPSFAGLAVALDAAPCGPAGLTLTWESAPAWGTGSGGTYEVYRGTTPDFVPSLANRVATGLTVTTWVDGTAPSGVALWYVVRARSDEDCGGEGADDGNLIRRSATETASLPAPAEVPLLAAAAVGSAHVRLSWNAVPGATHYVVRRSESPDFSAPVSIGVAEGTLYEDVNAVGSPDSYYYRVFAANACDVEGP